MAVSPKETVQVAYLHIDDVAHSFADSYKNMLFFDAANHGRIMRGGEIKMRCGSGAIPQSRNKCAAMFLADEDKPDWLLFIDTDMGFAADSLERLLAVADKDERPIVGGLCFAQKETGLDGMSGYNCAARFTIFDWIEHPSLEGKKTFVGRAWYSPGEVVQCAGTGAAFILIHRSVLEAVLTEYGPRWFDRHPDEAGELIGEDLSFCLRAGACKFPVYVHTGVKTTHLKQVWLGEAEFWMQQTAPPATDPVDVIVPVMKRPQNAEPFMESLKASTGLARAIVVADEGDTETIKAWDNGLPLFLLVHDFGGRPGTFAEKVNHALKVSTREWLFLVGDDVRFHPGWLDHAQYAAANMRRSVVGTNDLANPRVMSGTHATHLLIRRDYIDEQGASWDGPGIVCHEGYRHWYVDDEIVTAAKQRSEWVMSLASVVEHLHPIFGKGTDDEVYELGQSHADEDGRLWRGRLKAYG